MWSLTSYPASSACQIATRVSIPSNAASRGGAPPLSRCIRGARKHVDDGVAMLTDTNGLRGGGQADALADQVIFRVSIRRTRSTTLPNSSSLRIRSRAPFEGLLSPRPANSFWLTERNFRLIRFIWSAEGAAGRPFGPFMWPDWFFHRSKERGKVRAHPVKTIEETCRP